MTQFDASYIPVIKGLVARIQALENALGSPGVIPVPGSPSGGADPLLTYLTELDETAGLPNSRQLLAGDNVTLDDTVPGELTIHAAGGGSPGDGGTRLIGIVIDGSGSVITTGVKGYVRVPYTGTITKATVLSTNAGASNGSIVIDVWKDTYANYPPTIGDSITASTPPTLSSANKSEDTTLSGWTTSVTSGDVLGFTVNSASTVTRVWLGLEITT